MYNMVFLSSEIISRRTLRHTAATPFCEVLEMTFYARKSSDKVGMIENNLLNNKRITIQILIKFCVVKAQPAANYNTKLLFF